MRILVTNDDGIDSEGLIALRDSLSRLGETVVIAPDRNWSAAGHNKTMHKPLRVTKVRMAGDIEGYSCDGTPSDCVAMSMLGLAGPRPDLVVSGINKGANLGGDVTYSGTVAAAMEAVISGVPGIAVSISSLHDQDFQVAADFAAELAGRVMEARIDPTVLLNVNVPSLQREAIKGVLVTRLGRRVYRDQLIERKDPFGRSYYWIGGDEPTGEAEEGTDIGAIANGFISVTPIHMDLTNYSLIDQLKGWNMTV